MRPSESIRFCEQQEFPVNEQLIGRYLQDKQIAKRYAVYYDVFRNCRSDKAFAHSSAQKLEEAGRMINDCMHNLAEKARDDSSQESDCDAKCCEKTA